MLKRLAIALFAVFLMLPISSQAHELLPRNVLDFIQQHPDASVEELQIYIAKNAPDLVKSTQNKKDIDLLLGNQQTNFWDNSLDFFALGVTHILSGPDHILFVLSLLLAVVSLKGILQLTGTFTVAHSITLLLAGAGILTLPSHVVEPIIAFSISYVALRHVFLSSWLPHTNIRGTAATVFFFGLFHGLGFAGLLKEIRLPADRFLSSLISFNLGIELGQILIVASVLPFLLYFRNHSWYTRAVNIVALLIATTGIIWGIQRIFS